MSGRVDWIELTYEETVALGKPVGLGPTELDEIRRHLEGDLNAISAATWSILDAQDLIGPSGALMADVCSLFWRQAEE